MIRIGFLGVRHVHAPAYVAAFRDLATLGPVYESNAETRTVFTKNHGLDAADSVEAVLSQVDAAIVAGTNAEHYPLALPALQAGKHVLCEKPLVLTEEEGLALNQAASNGATLMTAFPCPYSPAFQKVLARVQAGELGTLRAICATNHGSCPGDWFIDPKQSGGGAIVDHTVHVADLLYRLLGEEPETVFAKANSLRLGLEVEDSAILTLKYRSGIFATLDASWSRPASYKTWGDVKLNVVGDQGTIEANLFNQTLDVYQDRHRQWGYGSNLDRLMAQEFVQAIQEGRTPRTSGLDGLRACQIVWAAQKSVASGQPEPVRALIPT